MAMTLRAEAALKSQRQAALARHPDQTGIDYITAEPGSEPGWDLLVHFIPPAGGVKDKLIITTGITADNIRITGGQGHGPSDLEVKSVTYPKAGGNVLTVTVGPLAGADAPGEAEIPGTYLLELVGVTGVDRFFDSGRFKMTEGAAGPLDPDISTSEGGRELPDASVDYLAKDYASFRKLMLDQLSVMAPQWTERSPADLGIVLVELLAYAADYLSCYQDAVATEAYLGTARKRESIQRHARLLGYQMHQGCNAQAWVSIQVGQDMVLPQGTPLLSTVKGWSAVVPVYAQYEVLQQHPTVFETMHSAHLFRDCNFIRFHDWGVDEYLLPRGTTQATLSGHHPDLQVGHVLIFEEVLGPNTGAPDDAEIEHRHVVRLTMVGEPTEDTVQGVDVTEVEWSTEDALPFDLWVSASHEGHTVRDISVALGNVVIADHGMAGVEDLQEVPIEGTFRPRLEQRDITYSVPYTPTIDEMASTVSTLEQDPRNALPAVTLFEYTEKSEAEPSLGDQWTARLDLVESGRFAQDFKVEMEDDGTARLLFGDDVLGQQPLPGTRFRAFYRLGNGSAGNVGADSITHVVIDDDRVLGVRNPPPARGGVDPEPIEDVRLYAPQTLRVQHRCVTTDDYRATVERHAEVQKAVAKLHWTGSWQTVFIYVDRYGGKPVDDVFKRHLSEFLDPYRMAGYDLEIRPPRFVPLDIALTVYVAPGYHLSAVRRTLSEVFSSRDLPDDRRGFFHPDNFTFGQAVYSSKVVARATEVPGVRRVDLDRFRRWSEVRHDPAASDQISLRDLEIARLDNDPSRPWNGTIAFTLKGEA